MQIFDLQKNTRNVLTFFGISTEFLHVPWHLRNGLTQAATSKLNKEHE